MSVRGSRHAPITAHNADKDVIHRRQGQFKGFDEQPGGSCELLQHGLRAEPGRKAKYAGIALQAAVCDAGQGGDVAARDQPHRVLGVAAPDLIETRPARVHHVGQLARPRAATEAHGEEVAHEQLGAEQRLRGVLAGLGAGRTSPRPDASGGST